MNKQDIEINDLDVVKEDLGDFYINQKTSSIFDNLKWNFLERKKKIKKRKNAYKIKKNKY